MRKLVRFKLSTLRKTLSSSSLSTKQLAFIKGGGEFRDDKGLNP